MRILKVLLKYPFTIYGFVTIFVGVLTETIDQSCYGTNKSLQCSQHSLQCKTGKIFIVEALRGFKPWNTSCNAQSDGCSHAETCCRKADGDCQEDYTLTAFNQLRRECWDKPNCTYKVTEAQKRWCNFWHERISGFSTVQYMCLPDSSTIDFRSNATVKGFGMVMKYTRHSGMVEQARHCRVESADCRSHPTSLLLTKLRNKNCSGKAFSQFCLNDFCFLCSRGATYAQLRNIPTPFHLSVYEVKGSTFSRAWGSVHALDSTELRVTCGIREGNFPPACSTFPPTATTPETSALSISTTVTPSSATAAGPGQPPGGSINIAATVGGTVVATLVAVLIVLAIIAFICIKRRAPEGQKASTVMAWLKGGNVGESAAMTSASPGKGSSDVTPAHPTSHPVRVNTAAAAAAGGAGSDGDPDSDYHHLGQKPASHAPRDVTYGRLAYGDDITENAYDRVARGKPAGPSGEVINNDYDTARPLTTASPDGGEYDVTSVAGNRRGVINNVYNTASQ